MDGGTQLGSQGQPGSSGGNSLVQVTQLISGGHGIIVTNIHCAPSARLSDLRKPVNSALTAIL